MKFIVSSSGVKTDFSEIKDTVAFLDNIRKREISIHEARYKQEEFGRYLKKKKKIGNKPCKRLISFLMEEKMLLNL